MKKILRKFINDEGGLNSLGYGLCQIFTLTPVVILFFRLEMILTLPPLLVKAFWGWCLLSILFVRLFLYSDQKPFARWSKSRERENQQSTTSVSDSTIRDTTNKEDEL